MSSLKYHITFIKYLHDWSTSISLDPNQNDLSKLKVLKLIFLACSTSEELLNEFEFSAMPLGPVETNVLKAINRNELGPFSLLNFKTEVEDGEEYMVEEDSISTLIKNSIDKLKNLNPELINMSAYDLVELTHEWNCWKENFSFAKSMGKSCYPIAKEEIINESNKLYKLA